MNADRKDKPNAEIVELLHRVLDLLNGPQKNGGNLARVEEVHSFTASGIACEPWDETAARWTIAGALGKFSMTPIPWPATPLPGLRGEMLYDAAYRYLFAAAIIAAPQTVNGVNNRGWDAARDTIELAILLAEHGASIMPALMLPNGVLPSPELRKRLEMLAGISQAGKIQVPS